jgi:hypothetical protein
MFRLNWKSRVIVKGKAVLWRKSTHFANFCIGATVDLADLSDQTGYERTYLMLWRSLCSGAAYAPAQQTLEGVGACRSLK